MNKYILITDIGRDTDDTLALLILLKKHKNNIIKLLAICVSGAKLNERANSVYYWLNYYNITDISVITGKGEEFIFQPIDVDEKTKKIIKEIDSNICILPYKKNEKINDMKKNITTYNNLEEFFKNNENIYNIDILCISPVRPFERCLRKNPELIKHIKNIYFQGNAYIDNGKVIADIRPNGLGAYNFGNGFPNSNIIQEETQYVMDLLNKYKDKKLYFLGKNAAYLIEFNYKDFVSKINKKLGKLAIKKTILFAKNLPNVFNIVFKNNIIKSRKKQLVNKYIKHILKFINNKKSKINIDIEKLKKRIILNQNNVAKYEYLKKELLNKSNDINNLNNINNVNNTDYINSSYKIFIEYFVDENNIYNKYTTAFLKTINKISNPYDLVLIYLALYEDFFDLTKSKFKMLNGNTYNKNIRHIHFNEKDKLIFKKSNIKTHMINNLRKSLS